MRSICWPEDGKIHALGAFIRAGESGRRALLDLARSANWQDAECGIGGLSLLGDERVVPVVVKRLDQSESSENPHAATLDWTLQLSARANLRAESRLVESLKKHVAGPPPFYPIVTLGHIDSPDARRAIAAELQSASGERLAHAILAAGIQGDVATLQRVREVRSNPDLQDLARRQWLAAYFLTVAPTAIADGLAILQGMPLFNQEFVAGWSIQTLCVRANREPKQVAPVEHRRELIALFEARRLQWSRPPLGVMCTDAE